MDARPLERMSFDAARLICDHPPRWDDRNKQVVFDIASNSGFPFEGQIAYARWAEEEPLAELTLQPRFEVRGGVYEYAVPQAQAPEMVEWYLNFADPDLFFAYGTSLLAQDELQVAEHPILGSLREALVEKEMWPETTDDQRRPTPVTITGVQRRCVIDTQPNPAAGRPDGLYGNAFEAASSEQVAAGTSPLCPPTVSNILAMAAPACGFGEYRREEMVYVLNAAYTGFSAARRESEHMVSGEVQTVVHTGFWGCGAFGGNRTLMTLLQALAADLAGVDMVFWAFNESGVALANDAHRWYRNLRESVSSVSPIVDHLVQERFEWGVSDGN